MKKKSFPGISTTISYVKRYADPENRKKGLFFPLIAHLIILIRCITCCDRIVRARDMCNSAPISTIFSESAHRFTFEMVAGIPGYFIIIIFFILIEFHISFGFND